MASKNADGMKATLDIITTLFKQGTGPEVKDKLLELKEMVLGLWENNLELKQENAELKNKAKERQSLQYESNVYWAIGDNGTKDGPYCPACHDDKGKMIRLRDNGVAYQCNVCRFGHRYAPEEASSYKPEDFRLL